MTEELEGKLEQYKDGAKKALIGLGVGVLGCTFNWSFLDELVLISGVYYCSRHARDAINYVRYLSREE